MLKSEDFFNFAEFRHRKLFNDKEYVWDTLREVKDYIKDIIKPNISGIRKRGDFLTKTYVLYEGEILEDGFKLEVGDATKGNFSVFLDGKRLEGATVIYGGVTLIDDNIFIGRGTVVESGALIKGPTIIGENTEVRQGAYIRGSVVVGNRCVVGHNTEVKSSVMLNGSKAGHFAYIGDSILGNKVNLGAGTKLANLKIFDSPVILKIGQKEYNTGLRKFGAILGDGVETGCNSVTSPGTLLGKGTIVYPNASVRGFYPDSMIIKLNQYLENVERRIG